MEKREYLIERYEDALFALLMDYVAEEEGIKAEEENERLKNISDAAIPLPVQKRCIQVIRKGFKKQDLRKTGHVVSKIVNRIAVAVLVLLLTLTTVFAVSEDFRTRAMNWMIESFEDHTAFRFNGEDRDEENQCNNYTIHASWLPNGMVLESRDMDSRGISERYTKEDSRTYLIIKVTLFGGGECNVDTEDVHVRNETIQGCDAMVLEKDATTQILWTDENVVIQLMAENMRFEDVFEVAQNLSVQ